jgi:hypothetical protein
MFRRAWWRAIPSELLVPVAMAAVLDVASLLVPNESGGSALSIPTDRAREIVVLLGLLELRRRMTGSTSRLVAVAASLQGATVATLFVGGFAPSVLGRPAAMQLWTASSYVEAVLGLLFMLAIVTAARAWRSWLGPAAIAVSVVWRMPLQFVDSLLQQYMDFATYRVLDVVAMLLAQLALLAICRRLAVEALVPDDLGRAELGARRVAVGLRVRALVGFMQAIAYSVVAAAHEPSSVVAVSAISGIAVLGAVIWQTSGLVAMAGARVAGLSSTALGVAAFATLWEVLLANAIPFFRRGPAVHLFYLIVVTVGLVVAGRALHKLAARRVDEQLGATITLGIVIVVSLQVLNVGVLLVGDPARSDLYVLALVTFALQLIAMLVLSIVYARVAKRMQIAATVDVF